ncbi:MAG: PulJ/GspJ family protein [Phycisphaerales bacterium]
MASTGGPFGASPATPRRRTGRVRCRAFSVIEMLIATAISATLFTSLLVSLDAMFKGYEQTTDSASTQVISRIAVNRVLAMIRTGDEFGPIPDSVLNECNNPIAADFFEFVSQRNDAGQATQITRIEFRDGTGAATNAQWAALCDAPTGGVSGANPGSLWVITTPLDSDTGAPGDPTERLLLQGIRNCVFTLTFRPGPRLERATIDITIDPQIDDAIDITTGAVPKTTRIIASAMPRRI